VSLDFDSVGVGFAIGGWTTVLALWLYRWWRFR
jgi:hypothetical protein